MRPTTLLPLLAVAGFATAQTVNPDSVDQATRDAWCNDQTSACPILCSQTTHTTNVESNTCETVRFSPTLKTWLTAADHANVDLRLQRWICT
jgi:hypothetical protein